MRGAIRLIAAAMMMISMLAGISGLPVPAASASEGATPVSGNPPETGPAADVSTNDEGNLSSQGTADYIDVYPLVCNTSDPLLAGTFNYVYRGQVIAADTGFECEAPVGWLVTLANVNDPGLTYSVVTTGSEYEEFPDFTVEEGAYSITVNAGDEDHVLPGGILIEAGSYPWFQIVLYVSAPDPEGPEGSGSGGINGYYYYCRDPNRHLDVDFVFFSAA